MALAEGEGDGPGDEMDPVASPGELVGKLGSGARASPAPGMAQDPDVQRGEGTPGAKRLVTRAPGFTAAS